MDVSEELASLKHERKNQSLPKLPATATIKRRPIQHGPIASPYAGSTAQKVVYVSRRTPVMSAVKRVKKFLHEIEKRALQSADVSGAFDKGSKDDELEKRLEKVSENLQRKTEEVLVKSSGRAMEQALRIGEWFRNREQEVPCKVEVRTGSVSVVDDIVAREVDDDGQDEDETSGDIVRNIHDDSDGAQVRDETKLVGGETTMELLGNLEAGQNLHIEKGGAQDDRPDAEKSSSLPQGGIVNQKKGRKRKRKRQYDVNELPEARIRYVKTVEIAISLRA